MDKQTINVYDQQVSAYQAMIADYANDPNLARFIKHVKANGLVLDLGCGPGVSASVMQKQGLRVDPIDASEQMVIAANNAFSVNARQSEFTDIDSSNHYDGIWANFSLLHCTNSEFHQVLPQLVSSLKTSGIFHLAMKLGEGEKRDAIGRYYSYYSEQELLDICQTLGLSVLKVVLGQGPGLAGGVEPWIILLMKK